MGVTRVLLGSPSPFHTGFCCSPRGPPLPCPGPCGNQRPALLEGVFEVRVQRPAVGKAMWRRDAPPAPDPPAMALETQVKRPLRPSNPAGHLDDSRQRHCVDITVRGTGKHQPPSRPARCSVGGVIHRSGHGNAQLHRSPYQRERDLEIVTYLRPRVY